MSSEATQKTALQLQLEELVKVGVGGKYKDKTNYIKLVQEELEHEEAMIRGGFKRYNDTNKTAKIKRQEGQTLYGLILQQKYIVELSDLINTDVKLMNTGEAGNNNIALKLICQTLPSNAYDMGTFIDNRPSVWDVCSLIILKNAIDGISTSITLNRLAIKIANALMMEARIQKFKSENKEAYIKTSRKLAGANIPQNVSRYEYKSKVWVYMMNRNNLVFDSWSSVQRLHLGIKMVTYLERLGLLKHQNRKISLNKTVIFVEATDKIIEEIKNFNIKNELLYPKYLPMIMPPREWTSPYTGGYYGKKFTDKNDAKEIAERLQTKKIGD